MSARINYAQLSAGAIKGFYGVEAYLKEASVPAPLLHLIKLRASQINGCTFCVDMHSKEAKIDGEKELRLYHLSAWRESPLFTEKERAALQWTELVTAMKGGEGISNEAYEEIRKHFSDQEVSDLTVAIAMINAWNRLAVTFRTTPGAFDKMMGLDKAGLSS